MHILDQPLENVLQITAPHKEALKQAHIATVRNFLMHLPDTYVDASAPAAIASLRPGAYAFVAGVIQRIGTKKMAGTNAVLTEGVIEDNSGSMRAIWFTRLSATYSKKGDSIRLTGKVHKNKRGLFFVNPVTHEPSGTINKSLTPVYSRIRGIPPQLADKWRTQLLNALPPLLTDPLPAHLRKQFNLPSLGHAFRLAHAPSATAWGIAARKRFAFEEMFALQLHRLHMRHALRQTQSFPIPPSSALADITERLPFALTGAQKRAAEEILSDMERPVPMARLLNGDVGSGKTLVAIIASLAAVRNGRQIVYLAPTEILARQHFAEFIKHLAPFRVSLGMLTSAECKVFPSKINAKEPVHIARAQLISWVRDGKTSLLIGTHALLEKDVTCKKLALAIIDEQHRFGTQQRAKLIASGTTAPHLLSMTATPIPRTLALTLYGDLDVSLLDELPPGRKPPLTKIVPPNKRDAAYNFIRKNITAGGQAFVICPRIEEKEDEKKSVAAEYKKLSVDIFPEFSIAMLHGKRAPKEKEEIIHDFRAKKIHILVSTSVIEVGMDIPNASIIMIEGAENFGLASLHQFRGRVGRAGQQAYCFVFTDTNAVKTRERLAALAKAKNGFELAEVDLRMRGAGELAGTTQWGITDLGMEALQNRKMVEAARAEAKKIIEEDPALRAYPDLRERVEQLGEKGIHLE
jgi:ATP-dependent DNA helicase RecG